MNHKPSANPNVMRIPQLRPQQHCDVPSADVAQLQDWLQQHPRVLVLTGAGCSTASGIPAYRDHSGGWQRREPIMFQDFMRDASTRRRYWARSYLGWPVMQQAQPNTTHRALASMATNGKLGQLITQNVDGLHELSGHDDVINLHGSLASVRCLDCGSSSPRQQLQQRLQDLNTDWQAQVLGINPDGDAELDARAYPGFQVADCTRCGGTLKPDVVFFGESVPAQRVHAINRAIETCDAVLSIGTSLVVWSGYRIVRDVVAHDKPAVAVNQGRTRADALLEFKLAEDCETVLRALQQLPQLAQSSNQLMT
jgi:NAD-dependent SIR2 family protein deacetylase